MGLSCSSDEFCRRSDKVIEGLPGVRKLVDDILIQAPDMSTLQQRIESVIGRCKGHNFTLSKRKLEIGEAVEFAGQIVSRYGVTPNPKICYVQHIDRCDTLCEGNSINACAGGGAADRCGIGSVAASENSNTKGEGSGSGADGCGSGADGCGSGGGRAGVVDVLCRPQLLGSI